jgi:hypothetical protein
MGYIVIYNLAVDKNIARFSFRRTAEQFAESLRKTFGSALVFCEVCEIKL